MSNKSSGEKFRILILDTEGIQSNEGQDQQFDKRIMFYIMCVSHVILMCNKDEMNRTMAEILKLAADAIQNTREGTVANQSIFIILNQMTKVSKEARLDCVNQLQKELLDITQDDTINKVVKIS